MVRTPGYPENVRQLVVRGSGGSPDVIVTNGPGLTAKWLIELYAFRA
jgi:hypothetical protein